MSNIYGHGIKLDETETKIMLKGERIKLRFESSSKSLQFTAHISQIEELASQLLNLVFEATEVKENIQDNHQKMWKYIFYHLLDGEPNNSEFYRFCDRLKFNRFECNNGDLHLTSNAINTNALNNVIQSIFDITKNYDTGGHPVMKIIIHDNPHRKEHHHEFNGHQEVIIL